MSARLLVSCVLSLLIACEGERAASTPRTESPNDDAPSSSDAGADPARDHAGATSPAAPSFRGEIGLIFAEHCVGCHREGGSGPFPLDDYASAKTHADAIATATRTRTMPPSFIRADGACGQFADVNQLSDSQIAAIDRWVGAGAPEGKGNATASPQLATASAGDAQSYVMPAYTPVAIGGTLAATDDYHCFVFDAGIDRARFITGFELTPGSGDIHHVIGYLVDPAAPSMIEGLSNAEAIALEDMRTPDVPGWSCLANAGDTIVPKDMRATWNAGQGATRLPNESGVRMLPTDKVVVQVHYSVKHDEHGAASAPGGDRTRTTLALSLADQVANEGFFLTGDGLLDSLAFGLPIALMPGKKSQIVRWTHTFGELRLGLPKAELWGIYPHMHTLGTRYDASLASLDEGEECIAEVPHWNYHWQQMYAYASPFVVTPDTRINISCEFDTSARTEPTYPGMGTDNEMCAAFLYLTVPRQ